MAKGDRASVGQAEAIALKPEASGSTINRIRALARLKLTVTNTLFPRSARLYRLVLRQYRPIPDIDKF
jgi:hypothetical protein